MTTDSSPESGPTLLPVPSGWWSMVITDAHEYSRKTLTDRRSGAATSVEETRHRAAAWCVREASSAAHGAAVFRGPGILVATDPAAGAVDGELFDLEYNGLPLTGSLRPGGRASDQIASIPSWSLSFTSAADAPPWAVTATGYQLEVPPRSWASATALGLAARRRAWLDTLH